MTKLKPNQFILDGYLITELPILYQTEMVKAILDDRKKQTRRANGLGSINADPDFWNRKNDPRMSKNRFWNSDIEPNPNPISISFGFRDVLDQIEYVKSPFGKSGDLLWVRETFMKMPREGFFQYKANHPLFKSSDIKNQFLKEEGFKWKPSIHMPKAASRIWLMIEDIRVERLQEISEQDAIAEGIESKFIHLFQEIRYRCYSSKNKIPYAGFPKHWASNWRSPISSFNSLWTSINGKESLNQNPWVWVIKFRVLSKTGRPSDETILASRLSILASKSGEEVTNA